MKVILTGGTGFIGHEVLTQCLNDPAITSLVALSRRPLTDQHPKLRNIIHDDYTSYPPAVLSELEGAEAFVHAMGLAQHKDREILRRVNVDYVLATAKMCAESLAPGLGGKKKFRFVLTSGHYVEPDQERRLWIMAEDRKLRGRVDAEVMGMEKGNFEVVVVRPSVVLARDVSWVKQALVGAVSIHIRADQLGAAMVEMARKGAGKQVVGNNELVEIGERALKAAR